MKYLPTFIVALVSAITYFGPHLVKLISPDTATTLIVIVGGIATIATTIKGQLTTAPKDKPVVEAAQSGDLGPKAQALAPVAKSDDAAVVK